MPCPFPGMDPYIERPEICPDFHDRLITCLCGVLQPLLRPRYVALTQNRLYVVESDRPIYPDVSVIETSLRRPGHGHRAAVLEADEPIVFELSREEVRQPLLTIIEPAAGNRVVTAIEVLGPDNKLAGPGRESYLQKRDEFWAGGTNLVEIDLLRHGMPTVRISAERLKSVPSRSYLVTASRCFPTRQEVYPIPLRSRLPRIAVPLGDANSDVVLDLQAAFTRCWDEGPYPELLDYAGLPPGPMDPDDAHWCREILQAASSQSSE
jgi:hypothetical protein